MLNRKDLFAILLVIAIIFTGVSFMGSDVGNDQAFVFYDRVVLAPTDTDTMSFRWTPNRKKNPGLGKTEGYYTLVIIADSSVTDYGGDGLTVYSKARFFLPQVKGATGNTLADLTTNVGMATYQVSTNDSIIHASGQAFTLRRPLEYTLLLNMADGVVIFLTNDDAAGDSTLFHVYVYNK